MADSEMPTSSIGYLKLIHETTSRIENASGSVDLAPIISLLQQINAQIIMPAPVSLDPVIELGKMQVERLDKIIELLGH